MNQMILALQRGLREKAYNVSSDQVIGIREQEEWTRLSVNLSEINNEGYLGLLIKIQHSEALPYPQRVLQPVVHQDQFISPAK